MQISPIEENDLPDLAELYQQLLQNLGSDQDKLLKLN
jgi:hypothetical protein